MKNRSPTGAPFIVIGGIAGYKKNLYTRHQWRKGEAATNKYRVLNFDTQNSKVLCLNRNNSSMTIPA